MDLFSRLWQFKGSKWWTRFELTNAPLPDPQLQLAWQSLQWGIVFVSWNIVFAIVPLLMVIGITWYHRFQQIVRTRITQGFGLFILCLLIVSIFALNPLESCLGIFNFIPFIMMFAGTAVLIQKPEQLRRLAWLLVIGAIPAIAIGLGQFYLGWSTYTNFDLSRLVVEGSDTPDRMTATFKHANLFANYLAIVFAIAGGLWLDTHQRYRSLLKPKSSQAIDRSCSQHVDRILKIRSSFLWGILILTTSCLFLSNSRNGWIAAIASALAFASYLGKRGIVAIVTGLTATFVWAAFGPNPIQTWLRWIVPRAIWARLNGEMFPNQVEAEMRTTIWQVAINLTQQRPWTGWGLQSFGKLYEAQTHLWLGHPHNLVLMLTASVGIPIALFFLGLVGWVLAQGVLCLSGRMHPEGNRSNNESSPKSLRLTAPDRLILFTYLTAFGCCMIFQTTDVTIFDPRINFLGWFLLAAILGVVRGTRKEALQTPESNRRSELELTENLDHE
ncbi:O-antigen ligase family protein [Tumidithrix elongata RA019]|uniref:O-antigen ligase family protein n=1 Tax=Tumidithrix elongata BACA0141 TaxID=2716417 RepID=A0AAW9Q7X2_9CYAN|nr:O-antigen ligase family protein [Tumidithrix elongata RA019]